MKGKLDRLQRVLYQGAVTHDVRDEGAEVAAPSNLPRKFRAADPEWASRAAIKKQLQTEEMGGAGPNTGRTALGEVSLSERDIRALLDARKAEESAAFDAWFGHHFNRADLPTRRLGEELNPEYFEERENALVEKYQTQLRLDLMKLYGPRDEEDLMILFGFQTGLLREDADVDPADQDEEVRDRRFAYGMGSISRFLMPENQLRVAGPAGLFSAHGTWGAEPTRRPFTAGEEARARLPATYRGLFGAPAAAAAGGGGV